MEDEQLELQLIVTGSHLSADFGMSVQEIEAAGIPIARRIDILDASDTPADVAKAAGRGMIGFADALSELGPDVVVVLGDQQRGHSVIQSGCLLR